MSKEKLIPDLRFPEFKNEGEWTETILGSVVEMKGRIGYRGYTTEDIVDKGKGAITLSPSNFDANGQLNFDKCTYISWAKYDESPEIQLEVGQTVLVKTASVGKTAYVDKLPEKATVNPQIVVLKPKKIQNKFLSYTIAHQNTQSQISNCVGAGAIPNISQEIISKIKIILPPDIKKREQQKIALCLSSLDEVISAQSQKLDLLKEHKKGLMQNLFPQDGEKVPKYRFKEFENEGEWIETILGSVVEMKGRIGYRGYTTEDIVDKGKGAITLSPSNFDANGQLNFDKCTYISWAKYDESPEIQLEVGQTVLVKTASVGKTAYVDKLPEKATVNPQIVVLKPKKIQNKFLSYTIAHQNTQSQISNCVGAGAIPNISQEIISKIKIILPPDIKKREQQKIALCLSSLDEVISAQSQKLDLLKEHKKGLMQGLFPKIQD